MKIIKSIVGLVSTCVSVTAQCRVYWFDKVQRHNSCIG